jgi:sulfite exporter TauE/SafE
MSNLFGMISGVDLTGPVAALLAGAVTSLHCVGMCGPLACAACTGCGENAKRESNGAAALYHGARLVSYTLVGLVAGAAGGKLSAALTGGATRGMTWIFVLFFLAVVVGLDKKLRLPVGGAWLSGVMARGRRMGPVARAGSLGLLTPLLPCAPLYLVVAAAALAGSPLAGASLMFAFGLGTVPLLFLLQNRLAWLESKWSPRSMDWMRRGLALASIGLLLMRGTYAPETGCPMCH